MEGNVDLGCFVLVFVSNVFNSFYKQINNDHKHFERGSVRIICLKNVRISFWYNINNLLARNKGTRIISEQLFSFLE